MADPKFVATTLGLAVASQATPVGPFVHVVGFRVGSAFGYEPQPSDTGLNGALLYSGVPLTYEFVGDNTINVLCRIDARAGPFDFGEVCIDLAGGIMFAKAAFTEPQKKYTSLNTNVQSTYTFNALLKLQQSVAVFKIDTFGSPPDVWRVDRWADVYPPALSANPGIPCILVQEPDVNGNTSLIHQAGASHWSVGTNYEIIFKGVAQSLTASQVVVANSALANNSYVPFASYATSTNREYVIETSDGYLRSVNNCTGTANDAGTQTFVLNDPFASTPAQGPITIYSMRGQVMRGARLSQDANNLLALRGDGLYYGTAAPAEIVNMFVDAINGNDANIGSQASPVKTIAAVVDRGPPGVDRYLYLKEQQDHWVDPISAKAFRGGSWNILPYGPLSDALAPIPGDSKFMQVAAIALMPSIRSRPMHTEGPDAGGGFFQNGTALAPQGATVTALATRFTCADPVVGGAPISSACGTFMSPYGNGAGSQWILRNCQVDTTTGWFAASAYSPITLSIAQVSVIGSGKLCISGSKLLNVDFGGGAIGTNTITADQLMAYVQGATVATKLYNNLNTNITPSTGPGGNLTRVPVPNLASYTMPADRKGYYQLYRQEEANVGKAYMYLNGSLIVWIDVESGGNSGVYPLPLNPGDNVQINGSMGGPSSMYAEVFMYPVGANTWN